MYIDVFDKIKKPIFLNESSNTAVEIEYLKSIVEKVSADQKDEVLSNIKNLEYGLIGEEKIKYELKNSNRPMIILQDMYFEIDDLSCQIDFIVFTRYNIYIIESKNFYGDITVTDQADFLRKIFKEKKRIYSPVTQVRRHKERMLNLYSEQKKTSLLNLLTDINLNNVIKTLVVIANPSTTINTKYAPRDIKNMIVSVDNLVRKIIDENTKTENRLSEKKMNELAEFYLANNKPNPQKYFEKFVVEELVCPKCGKELVLRKSKKGKYEGVEFYGCSGFPKCRYIKENIEVAEK